MADQHDIDEHIAVFERQMELYVERDTLHQGLWKDYGAADNMLHIRSKFLRAQGLSQRGEHGAAIKELEDLINYSAFFIRNVRAGRLG